MKGAVLNLAALIADYQTYLESTGYAGRTIMSRKQHLYCLLAFINARGLKSLEEFRSELAIDFTDCWVRHQPYAKPGRAALRKSRFEPYHHSEIQ